MGEIGYCPETVVKTWSTDSFVKFTKSESLLPKGFSMIAFPDLKLLEMTPDKMKSKTWELVQNKPKYMRMMQTKSFLRDELDFLRINMSTHDQMMESFVKNEIESKKQMKLLNYLGKYKRVNKLLPAKVKDLLTAIEGSETAKTDTKIWKFLKRSSSLRNEFSNIRQYLIEIHAWPATESHYQSSQPSKVTCPNCRFFITTNIKRVSTVQTKIASSFFALFSLCLMPNILNCFKDTIHLCPLCKIYLGFCPALRIRNIRKSCISRNKGSESLSLEMIGTKTRKMVSASSTSAKNLFVESKLRLSDRVQVNVNNIAAIARQIQRGSKANENLMAAAKNFAIQEAAIENSEINLKKLKLLTTHMNSQLESLQKSSSKMELVLEQVRSMQR